MKNNFIILMSALTALTLVSGCSKQESAPPPPVSHAPASTDTAAGQAVKAQEAVENQLKATQQAADKAVADTQAKAAEAQKAGEKAAADLRGETTALSSKAQTLIDAAKKLVADQNWSEALKTLASLSDMKLTPEQQTMVDSLKQQAQKMAQDAAATKATEQGTKALGNLLNKK